MRINRRSEQMAFMDRIAELEDALRAVVEEWYPSPTDYETSSEPHENFRKAFEIRQHAKRVLADFVADRGKHQ